MKYSNLLVAALVALALSGCISLPADQDGRGAVGYAGTGASAGRDGGGGGGGVGGSGVEATRK